MLGFLKLRRKNQLTGKVSILIPVRGDSRYALELCLKSIRKNTDYPDYRFIICDDGVDESTGSYLSELAVKGEVKLVKSTNPGIPKDDLVRAVDTEYYIFMHDDVKILKKSWLSDRLRAMSRNDNNAIVGTAVRNFGSKTIKRFLPLGLLVKTDVSRRLGLTWGKQLDRGFDTGGYAYNVFSSQSEYKFVPYKVSRGIYHFGGMTWVKCKDRNFPDIDRLLDERERKLQLIRQMLTTGAY